MNKKDGQENKEPRADKVWIELVIELPQHLCDGVSDFLITTLGRGVLIEDLEESFEHQEMERIRAYLTKEEIELGIMAQIEQYLLDLKELEGDFPEIRFSTRPIIEQDWSQGWKAYFKPTRVGKRIVVKPSWENYIPRPEDIVIEIDPGMAFGTGTHPSTALILKSMERLWDDMGWTYSRDSNGPQVLDVGTGTGILGITAARLGASSVLCLDVDPDAVEIARENAYKNHVHHIVSVTLSPLWQVEGDYDVILANLDKSTLLFLAKDLAERLSKPGWLIISGILVEQQESVQEVFREQGLSMLWEEIEQEWICLTWLKQRT